MTQSTLRFLIAGIFTVGLLASLARGDDKQRAPELLPMPHCDACDKAADCCTVGAPCCQEGSDCCAKSTATKTGFIIVAQMPQGVDFNQNWGSQGTSETQKRAGMAEEAKKKQIAALMADYHALYKEHKYQEAELCALKAQDLDPDNYVVGAAVQTAHMAKAHQEYSEISKDRERYFRRSGGGAERPGPMVSEDGPIFSDPWVQSLLINRKLDNQITGFDYRDTPLEQIIDDLAGWSDITIVPDASALKDAKINLKQPVTLKLEGINLRTALSQVLRQAQLTYQVRNNALVITTKAKELAQLERRVFPVPDLVGPDSSNLTSFLSMLTENKKESPEATLIQFIQATVEPQSWSKSGGLAAIEYFPLGKAVVISQTPETQEKVQKLLSALRLLRAPQVAEAKCDACLVIGCDAPANVSEVQVPSKLETRVYTVADLVCPVPHMTCAEEDNAEDLIELIEHFIEPNSWKLDQSTKDKPGSIVFYERGKGLIVSQTPEVQERVQGFLESLRSLQGQGAPRMLGVSNPKVSVKTVPPSCDVIAVGAGLDKPCERDWLPVQPIRGPNFQAMTEFATPQLSNHEPAAQALPFITRDANGATRMGFTYGSFTNGPSPLPPPVPTFKVPQTVDGEKLTRETTNAVRLMQEGVRTELGTAGEACQEPRICDSPIRPMPYHQDSDEWMTRTTETLKAITPQCPSPIPPNPTFGQNCQPVQVEATRDCAKSPGTEVRFFVPQLGPVPVFLDFGIPRVNGTNSDQTEQNVSVKDYRVSVGSGIRIVVPMLGPVPVALDFGLPIAKKAQSVQACPVTAVPCVPSPKPVPVDVHPAQGAVQTIPVSAWFGFVGRENSATQAVSTHDAGAVPTSYAPGVPATGFAATYVPATPPVPASRHTDRWTIRVHTDGDRPSFSVQSENASMECERLVLKLKENGSLEFVAGKKSVRVRGKDFEAEAEMIECQNNDSKLVLSGKVSLTCAKNDCMVRANKVVWDSGEWHAYGAGSMNMSTK